MANEDSGPGKSVALFSAAPSITAHRPIVVRALKADSGVCQSRLAEGVDGVPPPWPRRQLSAVVGGSRPRPSLRLDLASQYGTASRDAARRAVRVGGLDAAFGEALMLAELIAHDERPVESRSRFVACFGGEAVAGLMYGSRSIRVLPPNVRLRLI